MIRKITPFLVLLLIALASVPGCTAPQGDGGTPTTTTTTMTATPVPGVTIPPGPVVTPLPNYAVAVQVTRNPNTAFPYITVTFRGGYGQILLRRLTVTVARSDGKVIQEVIPQSGTQQYAIGDFVRITGTTGTDEVAVVANINGKDYKIYDQNLDFYTIPPPPS
ncbi:MAG TPA: hypothetical protein VKO45_00825 [Methanomicrobiales archaeon]|nr:hypothetical protein [Methanomicrobiales archaeon]